MRLLAGILVLMLIASTGAGSRAQPEQRVRDLVARGIEPMLPGDGAGGTAVAVRIDGRTFFFNYGHAEVASQRPITSDTLFNLASLSKLFVATMLAHAIERGELRLEDRVAGYVTELEQGGDIRRVTIGQLATHTSGLLLPQDHPPWPEEHYTLPEFLRVLNQWKADAEHEPGRQRIYTHAGFILLQLALERRFGTSLRELIEARVLRPLGLASTIVPADRGNPRGGLDPALKSRAVQGYGEDGAPVGDPGDVQGYYLWPGTAQMFSTPRDMAAFLSANLGEAPQHRPLLGAMEFAHRDRFPIDPRNAQALAWEIAYEAGTRIVEKHGGLNNSSTYIGMIPSAKIGVVILSNRGNQFPGEIGRGLLLDLARRDRLG